MDVETLNAMLLGLVTQAILEGVVLGRSEACKKPDVDALNERRVEILHFVRSELASANAAA